ncbi:3-phosphoshikimate 1-carboxyvinyltransferase [Chloroflexus aggregans]|uniref:3-phosphoshikimate 1-carboxyvinyltransferase n=1 Tax=Chloroflexus aggregans (strain MD-66 / DSM 9485) TaxID=326427 RepID=AROA_CHLAD|nr:3-phosphoshikimate 1-carboxyvinyltransferase [Chloroflexus aggregans]B8GC95.1 RecName: Full=3-phosphoshikimate 1-carboxyvinyltransferase; AltName: Full=5-enolpyruvylshikimate-3-phosphate synthase; Short=EPSP synthase; Short=EPSPS [Chloroflexus aggregans DSM 9485]ACL23069.1 3-phosphoshikimate 1-carboxyvinyltransferase [Chloroflexus aggregans DSM 9485]
MTEITLTAPKRLRGVIQVPGDKSISHRSVLLNAIATGSAHITNFLPGADCLSSVACVRSLGVTVEQPHERELIIHGVGLGGLRESTDVLDCGNSGTTLRLLAGILSGQPFFSVLSGDSSLRSRPQRRVVGPLRAMGAQIDGRADGDRAPLAIRGSTLRGGQYELTIASAQVKSALLLAALYADGPLTLGGRIDSRDHTERMLAAMGVEITVSPDRITLHPPTAATAPVALSLRVPGDPSSAAFWWVAAAIHPDAELVTPGVCLNPTRTGALDVLRAMGAEIEIMNERLEGSELVGDVVVRSSVLRGTTIAGSLIPRLIDEIPVLAVAAACADGETVIRDAQELRAKETDRITTVAAGLSALGVTVEPTIDGMVITGKPDQLTGATLHSYHDHRLAMAWAVAALVARGETTIVEPAAVVISYPDFWQTLAAIQEDV